MRAGDWSGHWRDEWGALGGYSAANHGGDLSSGILFGAGVGAVTGALGGEIAPSMTQYMAESWMRLVVQYFGRLGAAAFVTNFGSGAISGYAGGKGTVGSILTSAAKDGATGIVTTPLGGVFGAALSELGNEVLPPIIGPYSVVGVEGEAAEGLGWSGFGNSPPSLMDVATGALTSTLGEIYGDRLEDPSKWRHMNIP